MKKTFSGVLSVTMMAMAGYAAVGVATTTTGLQDAEARRMGSSSGSMGRSSSFSRPAPAPAPRVAPQVAPRPTPAPASSMIGSNVKSAPAKPAMATTSRPVPRTWQSSPAQRASAGSSVQPFLMGVGGAIAGSMLYSWLTSPTMGAAHAATPPAAAPTDAKAADGLNIIKPQAQVKVFEGADIPAEFQEKMKANGVSVAPKTSNVTEYSKTVKVKGGVEVKVDVAELPVLVVYENMDGKLTHDLYVPI